jgi:glycosyltransferase involved in cell wall biosynthesis
LIRKLNGLGNEVTLISSSPKELKQLGKELECEVYSVPVTRCMSPVKDLISICKLAYYMRQQNFDIVHAHTPKGGLIGMISSWLARVPIRIYTIHGLVIETATGLQRRFLKFAETLSCKLAKYILAVSQSLRDVVIKEKICIANKINVLGSGSACGIDINKFTRNENFSRFRENIRLKYNVPEEAIVIGYVGRIVPDKGIEILVKSFEGLQEKHDNCFLLLVGDIDSVRDTLDDEILNRIESNSKIIFDNKFVHDVIPFYAAMDILTLPSKREGFGLTLIEAGALELPVIASNITGCKDAVVDGQTGLLVDDGNAEQLKNSMLELVYNPGLRRKLGENGRKRVMRLFDSKILVDEHINFYENLYRS